MAPRGQHEPEIILLKADERDKGNVGKSPMWVFETADCRATYSALSSRGVEFMQPPREAQWGVSALFLDLYGNVFNLAQHA